MLKSSSRENFLQCPCKPILNSYKALEMGFEVISGTPFEKKQAVTNCCSQSRLASVPLYKVQIS
jgi:hypothetical protein